MSEHPGGSTLLPQPLQLLCSGDSSVCTPTADAIAGEATSQQQHFLAIDALEYTYRLCMIYCHLQLF